MTRRQSLKIHLVRHAEAAERFGDTPDEHRSLTSRGRRRFRRVAAALGKLGTDPETIFTSPKVRAVQTAEILAAPLQQGLHHVLRVAGGGIDRRVDGAADQLEDADVRLAPLHVVLGLAGGVDADQEDPVDLAAKVAG